MLRNSEREKNYNSYLTYQEIQSQYEAKQSRYDLFDSLLNQNQQCADAQSCAKIQQTYQQSMSDEKEIHSQEHHGCRCSKIGCLKLYCQCFANGKKCGGNCSCTCCQNKVGNEAEIYQAKMLANLRHPGHFKGIPALTPTRRCTCKKSMCQKRYCQCYSAGMKCNQFCECKDCQNGHPHSHDQQPYSNLNQSFMEIQVQA